MLFLATSSHSSTNNTGPRDRRPSDKVAAQRESLFPCVLNTASGWHSIDRRSTTRGRKVKSRDRGTSGLMQEEGPSEGQWESWKRNRQRTWNWATGQPYGKFYYYYLNSLLFNWFRSSPPRRWLLRWPSEVTRCRRHQLLLLDIVL